jgi:hypothetical protein
MRCQIAVIAMAIILSACSRGPAQEQPVPFAVQDTPASAAGRDTAARATLNAAQAQRVEADIAIMEATAAAQRQADIVAQVTAAARATEANRAFVLTAAADVIVMTRESDQATATHEAGIVQAESQAQATAFWGMATRDAYAEIQREQELEAIKQEGATVRANIRAWGITAILIAFLIALAAVAVVALNNISRAKEIKIMASAYADMAKITPDGGVVTLANRQLEYSPQILLPPVIEGELSMNGDGELDTLGRIPRTVNGKEREPITIKEDRNPERTNQVLVRQLLRESRDYMDTTGAPRDVVPGFRHLPSFNADMWMRATDILARNKVIKKRPRRATKFFDRWDIDTALSPANLDRLDFSPTLTE